MKLENESFFTPNVQGEFQSLENLSPMVCEVSRTDWEFPRTAWNFHRWFGRSNRCSETFHKRSGSFPERLRTFTDGSGEVTDVLKLSTDVPGVSSNGLELSSNEEKQEFEKETYEKLTTLGGTDISVCLFKKNKFF